MMTYTEFYQFCILIVSLVNLFYQITACLCKNGGKATSFGVEPLLRFPLLIFNIPQIKTVFKTVFCFYLADSEKYPLYHKKPINAERVRN